MKNKIIGFTQLILVIAFIIGSFTISGLLGSTDHALRERSNDTRSLFVDVENITPSNYQVSFQTTGIISARSEINVTPEISGRVISVNPNFAQGGTFKKGETLFQIETKDITLNIDQLRANVVSAQTALNLEQAESAAALAEWQQIHGALEAPELVARKPQLEAAKANLQSAKAQLENAQLDLNRSRFSMPFNGRVMTANIEKGQFVTMGQSYGTVYDINSLEITASLDQEKLSWLFDATMPVIKITVETPDGNKVYDGIIKRGVSTIDPSTRFANIYFGFKETVTDIIPGAFATINAQGPLYKNVFVLPALSLQKTGEIWTVTPDNKLKSLEAKTIYSDEDSIVIDTNQASLNIVTSRLSGASDGSEIKTNSNSQGLTDNE